ncbi:LPD29 domain-containing protein [Nocardia takedensis]|uniref:LPD29 domain-containing protein n=1 Tax=Nocardia takedensis TaxID=259390 RepID=UPI003F75B04F
MSEHPIQELDVVATAKVARRALREQWPHVKFSVRRGTGTVATWLHVGWHDGPAEPTVSEFMRRFTRAAPESDGTAPATRYLVRDVSCTRKVSGA